MFYQFLLHQLMLSTTQAALSFAEFVLAIKQILHLPKADVIIILVDQAMAEVRHQQLVIVSQIVFFQMTNKTNLRILCK